LYNEFDAQANTHKTDDPILSTLSHGRIRNNISDTSGGREMKKSLVSFLLVMLMLMATGCGPSTSVQVNTPDASMQLTAPGPNPMMNQPDALGRVARAGAGLWHGIIAPVTLVISFFNSDVHMYEVHNAGSEYDLGFLLGVGLVIALLSLFVRMRR
jgi:hypothetical protein